MAMSEEEIRKSTEALKEKERVAQSYYDTVKKGEDQTKKYVGTSDKAILESVKSYKKLDDFVRKNNSSLSDLNKKIRDLHIKGALDESGASNLNGELKDVAHQLIKIKQLQRKDLFKKIPVEEVKKLNNMLSKSEAKIHVAENTAMSFADQMAKVGPAFMKKWSAYGKVQKEGKTSLQSYEGIFNKVGGNLEKMPGLMKKFGGAIKGVGASLGGISKLIAGWPGALLMAGKALWDVGMSADQMVKDANKAFVMMRGPDIMTGDVKKQFNEFNNQIFNARENIRVGFGVEQIRELLGAMHDAGLNIQTLNKGLLSYRDAIYVAGKASKTLGLALPQVGSMISKLMTNFRMDMDSIDKAFVQVAFDAGKSGLATDRFWTTIENASASMALYGTFITAASKTMKAFTEDMVGGADDATEATEDMFSVFKSGNTSTQAALLDLAKQAGVSVSDMFREKAEEFGKRVVDIQSEISVLEKKGTKTPEDVEHLKKLRAELASTQSKQQRALSAINRGSVVQTAEMGMLAGEAPKLLQGVMKKIGTVSDLTQFSGKNMEKLLVEFKAMGVVGVKEKTVRMLIDHARNTKNSLNNLLGTSNKFFAADIEAFKNNKDTIAKAVIDASKPGEEQVENGKKLAELLVAQLGMDKGLADQWAEIAKTDAKAAEKIANLIAIGDVKSLKGLDDILNSSDFINKYQITRFKSQEKTDKELAKATEDSYDQLVEGTLSYNEMVKMGKDEIMWRTSNLGLLQAMNKGVADIYRRLTRDDPVSMSVPEKIAQEQLKTAIKGNKELEELLEVNKKTGNITSYSQKTLMQKTSQNLKKLDSLIVAEQNVGSALDRALKAGGTTEDIGAEIKKAYKAKDIGLVKKLQKLENTLGIFDKASQAVVNKRPGGPAVDMSVLGGMDTGLAKDLQSLEKSHLTKSDKQKKIDELRNKYLQDTAKKSADSLKLHEKEKSALETMQTNLSDMNKTNSSLLKIQKLKLMGDKKSLKGIAREIFKSTGNDINEIERMIQGTGLDLKDVKRSYEAAGYGTKDIDTRIFSNEAKSKDLTVAAGQGLQKPIQVTSPGSMILHPGESILPRTFSEFKTVPTTNEPKRVGPGGGGGTSKSIQINVSATEKDLATRIANEVRAVINQEYIGVV